jgi:hypothetical protein
MSDEKPFRSPPEELNALQAEIKDVKAVLREISARLSRIERHAKRAFGFAAPKRSDARPRGEHEQKPAEVPTIKVEDALPLFDRLAEAWRAGAAEKVDRELEEMSIPDLKVVAHELGVSFATKPTRRTLKEGIIRRVKESVMLSKNTNVTAPRSERKDQVAPEGAAQQGAAADEPQRD